MVSEHGQPNQALSQEPAMALLTAGVMVSAEMAQVWNRFQPPALGGSLLARRATSVDQSIAWRSTLIPILTRSSRHTSVAPWRRATSVGSMRTTGLPS